MGYQHRDPRRTAPAGALRQELTEANRRARRAESALAEQQSKLFDAQLRAREARGERLAYERHLQQLREERDEWRDKASESTPATLEAADDSLAAHDKLIQRCRCGQWVYAKLLCAHCESRQQITFQRNALSD